MADFDFSDKALQKALVTTAHMMADAARPITLRYFRSDKLATSNKLSSGFDPVTQADRNAEAAMREVLAQSRPDDAIEGEEFGFAAGTSGLSWVLDPIDGTRGYISGTPTWGMLIAVNAGAGPLFGIVDQPYIDERFSGGFGVAEVSGPRGTFGLKTRSCDALKDAVIYTTFPEVGTKADEQGFADIAAKCKLKRYGMDCYAYALLAAGQIDLVVEAGLNSYDIQGPMAVVTAAGGVVTDWKGNPAHRGGRVLAAGSAALHVQALEILANY